MYSTQMNVLHDLCDILMAAPGVHPACSQPSKVHFDAKRKPQMRSHLPSLPGHITEAYFWQYSPLLKCAAQSSGDWILMSYIPCS